ncbi:hypothetical protein ACA30_01675 [Virgibacillus soli]|nr:hypothetical protein ACA30_01675 [Virgibacillus soli]
MNRLENYATPQLREVWYLLWDRLGPNRFIFILGFLSSLGQSFIMLLEPLFVNLIFNHLETEAYNRIYLLLGISATIFIFFISIAIFGEYLKKISMARLQTSMMVESADHAQRLPFERAKSAHSSDLVQRITTDTTRMTGLLNLLINDMGYQIAMFMLAAVYLFWLNWKIAIVLLLISPLPLLFIHIMRRQLQRIGHQVAEQEAVVRQCQQDALQGMEVIRVYGIADWIRDRFLAERDLLNKLYIKRMWWLQGLQALSSTYSQFLIICMALIVGWMAIHGMMALGAIVAFFTLVWRVNSPIQALGQLWSQIQEGLGASERGFTLMQAEKEPIKKNSKKSISFTGNELMLDEVSFAYNEHGFPQRNKADHNQLNTNEQLQRITLHLSPQTFTALVGPSGSGKSTVAKIAAGLLFPTQGQVLIGGKNILDDLEQFRQLIAYVPQDPYLIAGTIRENLLIAHPNPEEGEEDMLEAARKAQAHEFITALPNGYDTNIRENGQSLSGGQRQRLAIARAFLSNRPIWILDEATSALDTETENAVMKELWQSVKVEGHSLLVIAHRLTTVQHADNIIVMKKGKILKKAKDLDLLTDSEQLYEHG